MAIRLYFVGNREVFRYPLGAAPRTAVLVPWFRPLDRVRIFTKGWSSLAEAYEPEAIVGTLTQLLDLIGNPTVKPTHALIAVSSPGDALLTAADRDRLWRAFHVPVFEQIIGKRGELLAAECEAHDGLHSESSSFVASAYAVDESCCACGLRTPRLSHAKVGRAFLPGTPTLSRTSRDAVTDRSSPARAAAESLPTPPGTCSGAT